MPPFFCRRGGRGSPIAFPRAAAFIRAFLPRMTATSPDMTKPRPWWTWGHVLGLEAVLTALVWLPLFAHATAVRLRPGPFPFPPEYLLLGCAVWFVYAADRLMDGLMRGGPRGVRHVFAVRHWPLFTAAMLAAAGVVAWLLGWHVREIVLSWGLKFAAVVAGYFVVTWLSRKSWAGMTAAGGLAGLLVIGLMQNAAGMVWLQLWRAVVAGFLITVVCMSLRQPGMPAPWTLPRKLLGGLLFAAGTALIPCAHTERWPQLMTDSTVLIFGMVCALNSLGIRLHESTAPNLEHRILTVLHPWMLLTVLAGAGMEYMAADPWSRPLLLACGISAAMLLALHILRRRCSADALRLLADAAVILPAAAMLLWLR